MPHLFNIIMGVTGTLKTLTDEQVNIIKDKYKIEMMTFIPSVFPKYENVFNEQTDVVLHQSDADFNLGLYNMINSFSSFERPVLIFFETKSKLEQFKNYLDAGNKTF